MSYYFKDKTHEEISQYIENNAVVILPIGTTEEHGSHLPVGCDAIIARNYGDAYGAACDDPYSNIRKSFC